MSLIWFYILIQSTLLFAPNVRCVTVKMKARASDCSEVVTTQIGWLRTPNFPDKYPRYSRCVWQIFRFRPDVCSIQLTFTAPFRVTRMTFTGCDEDYLEVDDGLNKQRMCGEMQKGTLKLVNFPTTSEFVTITFRSTFHEDGGFEMRLKQLPVSCSSTSTTQVPTTTPIPCLRNAVGRVSRLLSPPGGSGCTYAIWRSEPRACLLQMDLLMFDVPDAKGCETEHVLLPDGQKLCGQLGGTRKFLEFEEGEDEKVVISNGRHNKFNIQITQLPGPCSYDNSTQVTSVPAGGTRGSPHQCDQKIHGTGGTILSPGYPGSFGPNFHCVYSVYRGDASVCALQLDFVRFSVGKHIPPGCGTGAFLELPGRNRLCRDTEGRMIVHVSEFQDPVTFEFHSDSRTSGKGFRIEVSTLPNTCPGFAAGGEMPRPMSRCFQEVSHQFGHFSSPPRDVSCVFVLRRADRSVCKAILQVAARHRLGLSCEHNFVRLPDGKRICISVEEGRGEVHFEEDQESLMLEYVGWHRPHFNLWVDQMSNTCGSIRMRHDRLLHGSLSMSRMLHGRLHASSMHRGK